MTVTLKEFAGGAAATTLSAGINNSVLALAVADGSTFPTGSTAPFVIVIGRGTASEEKILVTSRATNNFTLTSRGYDGSTAAIHSTGDAVEHCLDATTITDTNKAAVNTIGKITTAGDILVGTGSEALKRLAIGAAYKAIGANSGATDLTYLDTLASLLTAQGDLPYASAANTPARLAKGTAYQRVRMNAAANAPEWASLGSGANVDTAQTTASASFADLATVGPAVTINTNTSALVMVSYFGGTSSGAGVGLMGVAVSGASTIAASTAQAAASSVTGGVTTSAIFLITGLTAGSNVFTAKYEATGGSTQSFQSRNLIVIPL